MYVGCIGWNRQSQIWHIGVNQQMMMPRICLAIASLDDIHAFDAEYDTDRVGDRRAIRGRYEKYLGAVGR